MVVCTASSSDSAAETGPKSGELTAPAAAAASLSVTSPSVDKARRKPACVLPGLHAASTRQHARATRRITQSLRCHRSREHICVSTIADDSSVMRWHLAAALVKTRLVSVMRLPAPPALAGRSHRAGRTAGARHLAAPPARCSASPQQQPSVNAATLREVPTSWSPPAVRLEMRRIRGRRERRQLVPAAALHLVTTHVHTRCRTVSLHAGGEHQGAGQVACGI